MTDQVHVIAVLIAMGVVTFGLRALPFIAAQWLQRNPLVGRLGEFLPLAIMTLLLVHSLVGAAAEHRGGPWPELLAGAIVGAIQLRWRSALPSILAGTAFYVAIRNSGLL